MFNLGASEVVVILVVALIFLGPICLERVSDLVGRSPSGRASRHRRTSPSAERPSWRWSDWLLVAGVTVTGLLAAGLAVTSR